MKNDTRLNSACGQPEWDYKDARSVDNKITEQTDQKTDIIHYLKWVKDFFGTRWF